MLLALLIDDDHVHATLKSLVGLCFALCSQAEEVVVWRNIIGVDFGQPLQSGYCVHGANEIVYCPHRLQHHDLFGDEIPSLYPQPCPLQRLLQMLEL